MEFLYIIFVQYLLLSADYCTCALRSYHRLKIAVVLHCNAIVIEYFSILYCDYKPRHQINVMLTVHTYTKTSCDINNTAL